MRKLLSAAALFLIASAASAAELGVPYVPASDGQVLQVLPAVASDPRLARMQTLRREQQANPENLDAAVRLAQAYIDYGRGTGDARYLGRALALVDPWLRRKPSPIPALMIQATVLQSRHEFVAAEAVLQHIVTIDPDDPQAWLTLASVLQVQGAMDRARHACARLMGSMDALITAACIGSLDAVTGRAGDGYQVIELLLQQEPNEPATIRAWVEGLLADAARYQGRDSLAEQHFRAALLQAPDDNFLLADYADFLLAHGRYADVITLLQGQTQSDTSFLRLVLAETALKQSRASADTAALAQRFLDLEVRGDHGLYAREQARFLLDLQHAPQQALSVALDDWALQHTPEDAEIVLRAALAANQPQAAQPVLEFLQRTRLEYPATRALALQLQRAASAGAAP
jgi:predicted Zn-dependent protease